MLRIFLLASLLMNCLLPCWANSSSGNSPARLHASTIYPYSVLEYASYLEDPQGQLEIDEIRSGKHSWQASSGPSINLGLTRTPVWIKFSIQTETLSQDDLLLDIPFPVIDLIDIYIYDNDTLLREFHTGDLFPFSQRPIISRNFLIPLSLENEKSYQIYMRLYVDGSLQVKASVIPTEKAWSNFQYTSVIEDIYYGILFAMIAYNLFFFLTTREISYIYYSGYVISFALFNATLRGYGYQYLWPNSPEWNGMAIPATIYTSVIFMALFSARFLLLENQTPRLFWFFKGCALCAAILLTTAPFLPKVISVLMGCVLVISVCIVALVASWHLFLTGHKVAQYFCLALTAFFFFVIVLVFNKFGWVSSNFFTEYAAQIGSALEAILLSFAQADKMQAERRNLHQEKQEALQRSNQLKDEFLATISHEFRTPMNGIIGCIDLAQQEKTLERANEILDNAQHSAFNLRHLLDNVLLYSEALSGTLKPDLSPTAIQPWLAEYWQPLTAQAAEKGLNAAKITAANLPEVLNIDAIRLGQVLEHTLQNAVKFTEQGDITLKVDYDESDQHITFTVTDSGIGMTPEQIKNMFSLFQQADGSHHRKYGGLGVGTAVCKALIESMEGNISIASVYSRGSSVTFVLPAAPAKLVEENKELPSINPKEKTVLIVEDNPVNTLVLKKLLSREGYQVVCAENGKIGIEKVQENTIDLILMDCQMPVMDGFEAVSIIRKMPDKKAHLPIIAVTANTMSKDKEQCLETGMDDYIPKPIKNDELTYKVSHWLALKH